MLEKLNEILKTIILILLVIGFVFIGYEKYDLKKKEDVLIRVFTKDCSKYLNTKTNTFIFEVADLSHDVRIPESFRTKAIYECSKKIYDNQNK